MRTWGLEALRDLGPRLLRNSGMRITSFFIDDVVVAKRTSLAYLRWGANAN
jgi:hypothetical protein